MPSITMSPNQLPRTPAVPPTPGFDTTLSRSQAEHRLHTIETQTLPALARQRAFLIRTWGSDPQDGVPVFVTEHEVVWVHPAGLEPVATAVAEEQAIVQEVAALQELLAAVQRYDLGGSAVVDEIHEEAAVQQEPAPVNSTTVEIDVTGDASDEKAYTAWMRHYLAAVGMELWIARKERDAARAHDLKVECRELEIRLRRLTDPTRALDRAASRTA